MTVTHPVGLDRPTLDDRAIADAAARLVSARRTAVGFDAFPGPLPQDLASAYAIQATATAAWSDPVAGWKVARIPPALEGSLGAGRFIGPVFAGNVGRTDGGALEFPVIEGGFGAVEAEFVVRVAADAPADKFDYTPAEAGAFIAAVHAGIEVAGSPLSTVQAVGPMASVPSWGNNIGLIVGAALPGDIDALDVLRSEVVIDGQSVGVGSTANLPGGILASMAFALGMAARLGRPLTAGQWVSTGALSGVHVIAIGQAARVTFTGQDPMEGSAVAMRPTE